MRRSEFKKKAREILDSRDQEKIFALLLGMEHVECESTVDAGLYDSFAEGKFDEMLDLLVMKGLVNRCVVKKIYEELQAEYPDEHPSWIWEDLVIESFAAKYPLVSPDDYILLVPYLCSFWLAEHPEDLDLDDCIAFMGSEDYEGALGYSLSFGTSDDLESWSYLHYLTGDATDPIQTDAGMQVIAHCCNDIGAWGAGFVLALNKLSPKPREKYLWWANNPNIPMQLGMIQVVDVRDRLVVANIIGQHGIRNRGSEPPVRYQAIETGMEKLCEHMAHKDISYDIHMPRIGCGLAGGQWDRVEEILLCVAAKYGVRIYVYDLPEG